MSAWVIWIVAAGLMAIGEILTLSFFLGPIAIAAVLAGITALAGGGTAIQLIVFIVASIASLVVLRPIARRHLVTPAKIRTGTAALIGARAVALERVDGNGGSVKLAGEVWSARTYDEDEVLEAGARVQVMQIEGATALVSNGLD
jgi:membrane protein implicated in regulation of membrane protease activity